ncbi:hypothetical protein ACSSS7_001148 [Eimeria intestinalis]
MEIADFGVSSVAGLPGEATSSNCRDSVVYADVPGDNIDEMVLSCGTSEAWMQPSSVSSVGNRGGHLGPSYPPASGDFASFPSYSNISSNAAMPQQPGSGASGSAGGCLATADIVKKEHESPWIVVNALKREVFATAALLRALRMHAAAQTRGVSAASQQQLMGAIAPLVRSFELLSDRLAAAEAAKEPPPAELQEQHIHPFLFVLAQQQLQHRQQQGLNKQQQLLQQSCMRALASAVLRSLEQLLTVGLFHCRTAAGRRCLHALIFSLTNCVLQAAQRLLSATAVAALASEAYGGPFFAPSSPAAEEELLLLQCLDLLSNSFLGAAGHVFSDTCVARTLQCCAAVSLLTRASPLLRNAAAARAMSIARHLFASDRLAALSQEQQQQQEEVSPHKDEGAGQQEQDLPQPQQQAASPPQFMARLRSQASLRSIESGHPPLGRSTAKAYGMDCRRRFLALLARLLSIGGQRHSSSGANSSSTNDGSNTGGKNTGLPPFVSPPEAGASAPSTDGPVDEKDVSAKQPKAEEARQTVEATAAAIQPANITSPRDAARPEGLSGIDRVSLVAPYMLLQQNVVLSSLNKERPPRQMFGSLRFILLLQFDSVLALCCLQDFESILGHHGKEKGAALETRLFCLRLLCVALEAGKDSICLFPSLLRPLQAQVLPLVLQQDPRSAPLLLLSLTLRLSIFTAGGPPRTVLASEAQEIALDMLRDLCSEDAFGIELLLNFDCDIRRSNVFGVLLTLLMQLAAPRIPALRGSYRVAECGVEGPHGVLSSAVSTSVHKRAAAPPTASEFAVAKTAQQQNTPSGSSISPASNSQSGEGNKAHHHGAFHLRRVPQRPPARTARSAADGSTAALAGPAPESLATDAAGVTRPAGLSTVNRLALAAILRLIASLASSCEDLKRSNGSKREYQQQLEEKQLETESAASYFLRIQDSQSVGQRRRNKALLALGAAAFNASTKEAILQLEGLGLLPAPATPKSVALFLKDTRGLDLRTVGLYLSANKPWNTQVLKEFVSLFKFSGVGLVAALRDFLKAFRLPGESQQIERVMEAFANEFFRQQPLVNCPHNEKLASAAGPAAQLTPQAPASTGEGKQNKAEAKEPAELSMWRWVADEGFYCSSLSDSSDHLADGGKRDHGISCDILTQQLSQFTPTQPPPGYVLMLHKDTVFVLSYSIIMLNTDQHNSQVRSKMRVEDFLKNNRGINNGSDLPPFFLQNIYISIRHQEIKLKEAALPAAPSTQPAAGQKADAATKEHQQPDLFDVLAEGWTPVEGAGMGWAAFASPYGGPVATASTASKDYVRIRDLFVASSGDDVRVSSSSRLTAEGLEYEMFQTLWNSGCLSVLRGAFEASLDLRQLEEILCGCLSLAQAATILQQVAALNMIVAELCSYFVYSVPAHSQLILPPVMYLVRRSGALLREEGWGAIIELLLRLHALDLLPPALMGLDDFEGSGGTALYSLCNVSPPPFVPPPSRKDKGAARRGGGWLGDLTSILFALGDSDDESDGEDGGGVHGQLMAWPEEVNSVCDGLCVLRASTDFMLLPSTLAVGLRPEAEPAEASITHPASAQVQPSLPHWSNADVSDTAVAKEEPPRSVPVGTQQDQQQQCSQDDSAVAPALTRGPMEEEESAAAMAPYLRLKSVLAHGVRVDLAVAELFRQVEPTSSLSIAVVLLVHILLGFPSLRQNPGGIPCGQQKPLQHLPSSSSASQGASSAAEGASTVAASTLASVVPSSGALSEGPPSLQAPDEMGHLSLAEGSMLSSYVVGVQRQRYDADTPRSSLSSSSSAGSTTSSSAAVTSGQGSSAPLFNLPPPVWSPLRGGVTPPLVSYREFTDRLFCLEVLGALMLSELTPGSFSLNPSKDYGTALLQKSPWILCAVYLDAFLRRYAIGSAAAGVPNPLEAVGFAGPIEQHRQQYATIAAASRADEQGGSSPAWARAMLDASGRDPSTLATVQSVCSVFQAIGSRRLVETPASLPHWELLFIERLVVTILRICLRLLSDEDSLLLPVYPQTGASESAAHETAGCAAACQVAIHLLQLLTLLHPNVFCMHVQRIAQSAIILISRLNLRACSSPLLIQVLLALYQRLVPLPAFAPTSPLPQQLTQQQQQQDLARRILRSLSDWIRDPEALALLVLQHRNHYQMLLQTLMAFCVYTPPSSSPQSNFSTVDFRLEGEGPSKQQVQHQGKTEGLGGAAPYAANCTSLALLASLIPSIAAALQAKGEVVATRLAAAAGGSAAAPAGASGGSYNWRTRLDCQAMWLQATQVLAIVCSFSARPVKVKALAVLQQMLIRGPSRGNASEICNGGATERTDAMQDSIKLSRREAEAGTDGAATAASEYWGDAADDPYTWRLCLQLVIFPLLSFRFDYPYTPPAPGDAPPPPPQHQQHANNVCGGDSAYSILTGLEAGMQQRDPHLTLPWMALPTRRRLTPEVAITTLGFDEESNCSETLFVMLMLCCRMPGLLLLGHFEFRLDLLSPCFAAALLKVYQRKAAAASLACRLFLTKMEQLLQPFTAKGFYVDFAPSRLPAGGAFESQGPQEAHPGGIEGLLPPLTQLVQLLVFEAKQAPLIYRDAFLESMKNTLLVVLTCPAVAASAIPSGLQTRISPADILPLLLPDQQRQAHQPGGKEGAEAPQRVVEPAHDAVKSQALLAALSCLTDSQRLVVSAVSPFIGFAFPGVVQDLLLILPTAQPPAPSKKEESASSKAPAPTDEREGTLREPEGDREEESPDVSRDGSQLNPVDSDRDPNESVAETHAESASVQ